MGNTVKLDLALRYMLAGNAEFTVTSLKTGNKFTYKLISRNLWSKTPTFRILVINKAFLEDLAGTLYLNSETNRLAFKDIEDGLFKEDSIEIVSLLFVLNRLRARKTNIPVEIESDGRCGKCTEFLESEHDLESGLCTKCRGNT